MIKATVEGGGAKVTVIADGGVLRFDGNTEAAARLDAMLRPGVFSLYNPHRGGPYQGVDPADEVQVLDALKRLGARIEVAEVAELRKPAPGYDVVDTRDDGAEMLAMRTEDAPPIGSDEEDEEV